MKDEIKEIIEALKPQDEEFTKAGIKEYPLYLRPDQQKILLDYITNLQESDNNKQLEIMKLKDKLEQQRKEYQETYKDVRIEIKEKDEIITNLQDENEKLKNGYCNLKVKCNNGECDCTNEEYEGMVQSNMRGSLLLEDYKSRNEKAIEYIKERTFDEVSIAPFVDDFNCKENLLNILQGEDKDVKD